MSEGYSAGREGLQGQGYTYRLSNACLASPLVLAAAPPQGPDTDPGSVAAIREALSQRRGATVRLVNYTKQVGSAG